MHFSELPLLTELSKKAKENTNILPSRQFTFIDDLNRIGALETLKKWYKSLEEEGKRFGYVVNVGKSDLIAKGQYKDLQKQSYQKNNNGPPTPWLGHWKQPTHRKLHLILCEDIVELSLITKAYPQA